MSNITKDQLNRAVFEILNVMPGPGLLMLTGSDAEKENLITIGWLQFGIVWGEPTVNVFVRQSRYSYELLQKYDEFTINLLPVPTFNDVLSKCASSSGSYTNKFKDTNLTKVKSKIVNCSSIQEASMVLECKIIFKHDVSINELSDIIVNKFYTDGDYHQIITAKIINIKEK
ncbi:MAG: hypothetical protein A2015_16130 [Spirochaetes bacterium GWF1_31_7]|nr:MAG: hypothetical protein A2Y30_13500 [Spirochaetes bacterium GWE1_32_154]OHD49979.1 MAG: hypothetical protein A2Y29_11545 [Spirochaetes bacterium GWE2_31_10]OHD52295.1 MAG: hypothetical protein A2015_16130 [Spirochaetes bacterium GWF1_31_7]OHD83367.1 MAG: hypothetical protein A2355_18290 [Spirochaetes bacterium RIFOXYB1_FULL_32_8]HBD95292.1 flavin reductase [Spirochaetia bacterium]